MQDKASRRIRLTNTAISAMVCKRGINCGAKANYALVFDTEAPRLAVRVTAAGDKSFIFDGYLDRKQVRVTIGSVNDWGIEKARSRARELQTLIDKGIDPREQERERKAADVAKKKAKLDAATEEEKRQRYTLKALCEEYVEFLKARKKNKSASDAASAFRVHVFSSDYADLPAADITPIQVAELVRKVYESGKERTAGILRSYLTAAYNAARKAPTTATVTSGLIPFGITTNPADVVENIKSRAGTRYLSEAELKQYIESIGDTPADTALKIGLYTGGQRMAQLLRARVSDYTDGTLRLFDGKGKRSEPREHLIPVAPKAKELLDGLTADKPAAARILKVHPQTVGIRLAEICADMKVTSFDLRDIRRTAETMLVAMGISKETRAQLLSHGLGGVQDVHYDKHSYTKEKRSALVAWEGKLESILTGKPAKGSNVRHLKKA